VYLVSQRLAPVPTETLSRIEQELLVVFPDGYARFLQQYGEGTYRGWMNIQAPDIEVLRPFADYDIWEHDETSPITQEQIQQCVAIGTTIDGDFLAVHPQIEGILWLPRHSQYIETKAFKANSYTEILDQLYGEVYANDVEGLPYFEPWNGLQKHAFFLFTPEHESDTLPRLAKSAQEAFKPDFLINNSYTCKIFIRALGGYIRFNYANGREVAVFYEADAAVLFQDISKFLIRNHCSAL